MRTEISQDQFRVLGCLEGNVLGLKIICDKELKTTGKERGQRAGGPMLGSQMRAQVVEEKWGGVISNGYFSMYG